MSTMSRPIRPAPHSADEAVRRWVEILGREIEPDPLFRRRLRGMVVNQFVAEREGAATVALPRSARMGRIGRACLVASLAMALSVGGAMAASDAAVPGDLLYGVKRGIEAVRMQVAPAHLHDELAAYVLAERIDELGRMVESGVVASVPELAEDIRAGYEQLASTPEGKVVADERLAAQLERLDAALDRAPVRARRAVERAMSGTLGFEATHAAPAGSDDGADPIRPTRGGREQGGAGGSGGATEHEPPGQVDRGSAEDRDPKPDRTARPERTPRPSPTDSPEEP